MVVDASVGLSSGATAVPTLAQRIKTLFHTLAGTVSDPGSKLQIALLGDVASALANLGHISSTATTTAALVQDIFPVLSTLFAAAPTILELLTVLQPLAAVL